MGLLKKAISCLLAQQKETNMHLEKKYAAFKKFVQKCNKHDEEEEMSSALTNIENQLDEHA